MKNNCLKNLKKLLSKLPVFLFCVIFIKGYTVLFGQENSIAGVVLLVGLLMFMEGKLGFKAKQASIAIFVMFVIIIISPKLSLINPYSGIVINFVSIFAILLLCSVNPNANNQLTFMLGYIFFQGYDVEGILYEKRVISIIIGAVIISALYYIINHKKETERDVTDVLSKININSETTQWIIKTSTMLSLVMFVGDIINYPRTMWVSLTILSLVTPIHKDYILRRKARIPATIIGSVLFILLFQIIIPEQYQNIVMLFAGFGSMFITSYFIKTIYNSFSALTTSVILFSGTEAAVIRIVSNVIGVVICILLVKLFDRLWSRMEGEYVVE